MTDENYFSTIMREASEAAAKQTAKVLAESVGKLAVVSENDVNDIVRRATKAWVERELTPVIEHELDARKDEILAGARAAIAKAPALIEKVLGEHIERRLRGSQYERGSAQDLVRLLLGI